MYTLTDRHSTRLQRLKDEAVPRRFCPRERNSATADQGTGALLTRCSAGILCQASLLRTHFSAGTSPSAFRNCGDLLKPFSADFLGNGGVEYTFNCRPPQKHSPLKGGKAVNSTNYYSANILSVNRFIDSHYEKTRKISLRCLCLNNRWRNNVTPSKSSE